MKDHRIADKLIEQRFEEISKKTDALPKTQVNYIFVTDTHADEYLLKDENGKLTVFEPEDTVNDRINQIAKHLEIAVNIANKNDNIDFIAVGGDLMNAYCIKRQGACFEQSAQVGRSAKKQLKAGAYCLRKP